MSVVCMVRPPAARRSGRARDRQSPVQAAGSAARDGSGYKSGPVAARGQNSGQPTWAVYLDALVEEHGSLAAISERLAALGGWRDDVDSITRALRRLRQRGSLPGGKWGDRLLRAFGLPADIDARLRFMGAYHSRFV